MGIENNIKSLGISALPNAIRNSPIFNPTHLIQLASVAEWPIIDPNFTDSKLKQIVQYYATDPIEMELELHRYASELLNTNNIMAAWQVLLLIENE